MPTTSQHHHHDHHHEVQENIAHRTPTSTNSNCSYNNNNLRLRKTVLTFMLSTQTATMVHWISYRCFGFSWSIFKVPKYRFITEKIRLVSKRLFFFVILRFLPNYCEIYGNYVYLIRQYLALIATTKNIYVLQFRQYKQWNYWFLYILIYKIRVHSVSDQFLEGTLLSEKYRKMLTTKAAHAWKIAITNNPIYWLYLHLIE